MDNLIFFIILLTFSVVNGLIGKSNQEKGKPSAFNWFVSGWCGFAALTQLTKLILIVSQN